MVQLLYTYFIGELIEKGDVALRWNWWCNQDKLEQLPSTHPRQKFHTIIALFLHILSSFLFHGSFQCLCLQICLEEDKNKLLNVL